MIKKIIFIILGALLGFVFIFSAYTKLYPIELFELTFIDIGVAGWKTAPFISRILIGAEFFLGILLLLQINYKKFTLKAVLALLTIFTVYLTVLLITEGNKGNCKCFGNVIYMTPLESILKNILMIAITIIMMLLKVDIRYRFQKAIFFVSLASSLIIPFILNPPDFIAVYQSQPEKTGYKLELDSIYYKSDKNTPSIELRKGKHIIVFLSLRCKHCRIAAYKIHLMHKQNPELPFFFVLNGDKEKLNSFYEETKTNDIPYIFLNGEEFIKLAGYRVPAIMYVNNSIVEKKVSYITMDYKETVNWVND